MAVSTALLKAKPSFVPARCVPLAFSVGLDCWDVLPKTRDPLVTLRSARSDDRPVSQVRFRAATEYMLMVSYDASFRHFLET